MEHPVTVEGVYTWWKVRAQVCSLLRASSVFSGTADGCEKPETTTPPPPYHHGIYTVQQSTLVHICVCPQTLAALPGSAASQASFSALICSSLSVSFFTSIYSASDCSLTTRSIQWGLLLSKLYKQTDRHPHTCVQSTHPLHTPSQYICKVMMENIIFKFFFLIY